MQAVVSVFNACFSFSFFFFFLAPSCSTEGDPRSPEDDSEDFGLGKRSGSCNEDSNKRQKIGPHTPFPPRASFKQGLYGPNNYCLGGMKSLYGSDGREKGSSIAVNLQNKLQNIQSNKASKDHPMGL